MYLQALYYLFAVLGMELFSGKITAPNTTSFDPTAGPEVTGYGCGTYEQLQYWANNFDDFAVCIFLSKVLSFLSYISNYRDRLQLQFN